MAVQALTLSQDLQPWHEAGLNLLYFPDAGELHALLRPSPGPAPEALQPSEGRKQPKLPPDRSEDRRAKAPFQAGPLPQSASSTLNIQDLPEVWQTMLPRFSAAPIIWTYAELGADLLGKGDGRRGDILRRMLRALKLPRGSSAFLPLNIPGASPQQEKHEEGVFLTLLEWLGTKAVVIFGQGGLDHSPYASLTLSPFQESVTEKGRLVIMLPALDVLLDNNSLLEACINYLRPALAKVSLDTKLP